MKFDELLNEVFVRGNPQAKNAHVIAFRQYIWIVAPTTLEDFEFEIRKVLHMGSPDGDFWELMSDVGDQPDIVSGRLDRDTLTLQSIDYQHSRMSTTLQKVVKALNIEFVNISYFSYFGDEDGEWMQDRSKFVNKNYKGDTFYHGTHTEAFKHIKKTGIRPVSGVTNFDKIKHADKIFVTTDKTKAEFHAGHSARLNDSFPLILEVKLPDPDKLVMDYDVAIGLYGTNHPDTIKLGYRDIVKKTDNTFLAMLQSELMKKLMRRNKGNIGNLSTKSGVFGYLGRIPPAFIEKIWMDDDAFKEYIKSTEGESYYEPSMVGQMSTWDSSTFKEYEDLRIEAMEEYEEEYSQEEED